MSTMKNTSKYTILMLFAFLIVNGCNNDNKDLYIYKLACDYDSVFMINKVEKKNEILNLEILFYDQKADTLFNTNNFRFKINRDTVLYIYGKKNCSSLVLVHSLADTICIENSWHPNPCKAVFLGTEFDNQYNSELYKYHLWDNCIDGLDVYLYFDSSYLLYKLEKSHPQSEICNMSLIKNQVEASCVVQKYKQHLK